MAVMECCRLFTNLLLLALVLDFRVICGILYEEGDECQVSSELTGVCKVVQKCPQALSAIRTDRRHSMKRCGFTSEHHEIVCCPTTGINATGKSKRKSDKFCEEISNNFLSFLHFHTNVEQDDVEGEFPHMAALGYNVDDAIEWQCGASIISKNFLLTAAHCVIKRQPTKVRVGVSKLNDGHFQDFEIQNVTIHERFNIITKHNDIAVVKIKGEIKFSKDIYPACLYHEDDEPKNMIVTGWSQTGIDKSPNELQKLSVVAFDLDKCKITYANRTLGSKTIDRSQFCVVSPSESSEYKDNCWGSSGGPCQIRNQLQVFSIVGILSYGVKCEWQTPVVYTRVSEYIDWIEKYVWNQ